MVANTSPIFGAAPDVQVGGSVIGPTAVTLQDGTGATPIIFMAGANGSFVDEVRLKPVGSPAGTVARVFFCTSTVASGSFTAGTTNTAANTSMIAEISLAAVTTSNSVAQNDLAIPIRKAIPASTKLLIGFGTSTGSAGTGYAVAVFGSDY